MKIIFCTFLFFSAILSFAQTNDLHLQNAVIIGQLDKADDRYSIEIALTELLTDAGIKAIPSLNILKVGSDVNLMATDSIQQLLSAKGINTYVTVSVRGYDKRFKKAENHTSLKAALDVDHLFPLYRDELVSITFEFTFYREGQFMATDIVKCGNISSRDTVLKRFRKKVAKRILKWM